MPTPAPPKAAEDAHARTAEGGKKLDWTFVLYFGVPWPFVPILSSASPRRRPRLVVGPFVVGPSLGPSLGPLAF